jgi:hypothetical protein
MTTQAPAWSFTVGLAPHKVTVFEDWTRGGVVHMRWHVTMSDGSRRRKRPSLGFTVRTARNGLNRELTARATAAAREQYERLLAGAGNRPVSGAHTTGAALTIADGWKVASDTETGKWNTDTRHRRDIERAIKRAVACWGGGMTWADIERAHLRKFWRAELRRQQAAGRAGIRSAWLLLQLVLAVGEWLREEQRIPATAATRWKRLKEEFQVDAGEYTPNRPRYTNDEFRRLLSAAWQVDQRYGLLFGLGAEFRLGQVVRSRRSHLERDGQRLRVPGRGKKHGGVIDFTPQQLTHLSAVMTSGYLAGLEAAFQAGHISDYPLFPGGNLPRTPAGDLLTTAAHVDREPIDKATYNAWHRQTEAAADVPHIRGRGPYGARRTSVDGAKAEKISREGMTEGGAWSTPAMADSIYADQEKDYARAEAAAVRAKVRGEPLADDTAKDQTGGNSE